MDSVDVRMVEKTKKPKKKANLALVSMILGIVALVLVWLPPVSIILGLVAAILGIVALVKKGAKGKSITGIILGVVSFVLAVVLFVLSAIVGVGALFGIGTLLAKGQEQRRQEELNNTVDVQFDGYYFSEDEYGWIDSGLVMTVTNKGEETVDVTLTVTAYDLKGNQLDLDYIWVEELAPGDSVELEAFQVVFDDVARELRYASFMVTEKSVRIVQ